MKATWCGSWTEPTYLVANYTGYQNSTLVHKQQPVDSAAFCRQCGGTTSNLFKTTTTGTYATTFLKGQQFTEVRGYITSELLVVSVLVVNYCLRY